MGTNVLPAICMCAMNKSGTCETRREVSDPLELELQLVVSCDPGSVSHHMAIGS